MRSLTVSTEDVHQSGDSCLAKRLARRWTILQILGVWLMLIACAVEWAPPDDPALSPTRPFLLMIGLLVFVTGRVMRWEWVHSRSDITPGHLGTVPPSDDQGCHREGESK